MSTAYIGRKHHTTSQISHDKSDLGVSSSDRTSSCSKCVHNVSHIEAVNYSLLSSSRADIITNILTIYVTKIVTNKLQNTLNLGQRWLRKKRNGGKVIST